MINKKIVENYDKLSKFINESNIKLSARIAYNIVRDLRIMEPIVNDFFIARQKIIDLYSTPVDDQPGTFKIVEGMENKLTSELEALDNINNDITFQMITMKDLDNIQLSLNDMDALYFILDGED